MTVSSSSKMGTVGDLGVGARKPDEIVGEKAVFGMAVSNGSSHLQANGSDVSGRHARVDESAFLERLTAVCLAIEVEVFGSDASGTETKECGICSTAVVDRGVLDCCNDWFCFACIDDWATVTNLCPLCKARFRFITCLPVRQGDGREGDLSAGFAKRVDGPNEDDSQHPFSFPSYFIDEEAVLCLEGDACRVRAGLLSQTDEGEIAADTSVACDLCDCWYHAGCVDFDPDQPSFYCPRCRNPHFEANGSVDPASSWPQVPTDATQSLLGRSLSSGNEVPHEKGTYHGSTSVDEGRSVVPISTHGVPGRSSLQTSPAEENVPMWSPIREPVKPSYHQAPVWSPIHETLATFHKEDQWSPTPGSAVDVEKADEEILWSPTPEAERFSRTASEEQASSSLLFSVKDIGSGSASTMAVKEDLTRRVSFASVHRADASKDHGITNRGKESGNLASRTSEDCKRNASSDISSVTDSEEVRVDIDQSQSASASEQTRRNKKRDFPEGGMTDFKNLPEPPQKVTRTAVKRIKHSEVRQVVDKNGRAGLNTVSPDSGVSHVINDQTNSDKSASATGEVVATSAEKQGEEKSSQNLESGTRKRKTPASRAEVDVMDIVGDPLLNGAKKRIDSSKKQDGVRTRIIMHREQNVTDAADSSIVGRIREQMREGADYMKGEVVQVSDDRFIAAFKAAVARSRKKDTESKEATARQTSSSHASKSQTREVEGKRSRANLTRKLYAGGTGRWDRDWDISFWKERSARGNASRKEAGGEKSSRVQSTKAESVVEEDSILSRVFVADNSLFPRTQEAQPTECQLSEAKGKHPNYSSSAASGSSSSAANATDIVNNSKIADRTTETSGGKERSSLKGGAKSGTPPLQASKSFKVSESTSSATDVRKDKRQWALDVLARKTGITANGAGSGTTPRGATNAGGQWNLMVQLPDDMRPLIPHDRHSKVPTAVRQVQLNRIIEQELKFTNLGIIRRCPETEEAIHKATAREEEIHNKANSKGVYVNLCVRALAQAEAEEQSNKAAALNRLVHSALQATGLIDTPPGSPHDEDVQISTSMNNEAEAMAEEVADKLTGSEAGKLEEFQNASDLNSNPNLPFNYDGQSEDKGNPEPGAVSSVQSAPQDASGEVKKNKLTFVLSSVSTKDSEQSEKPKCSTPTDGKLGNGTNIEVLSPQADETGNKSINDQHAVTHSSAEPSVNITGEVAHSKPPEIHLEQETLPSNALQERDAPETAADHEKKSTSLDTACASEGQVTTSSERDIEEPSRSPSRTEEPTTTDWMESGKFADLDRRIEDIRRKTSPSADKDLDVPWSSSRAAGDGDPFNSPFSVQKQVEIFVNQHLKPLYKSGVIKADQFRYTVSKTAAKVMEYHENAVSADFLISEGAKVRKLADQYLQTFSKRKIK